MHDWRQGKGRDGVSMKSNGQRLKHLVAGCPEYRGCKERGPQQRMATAILTGPASAGTVLKQRARAQSITLCSNKGRGRMTHHQSPARHVWT